MVDSVKSVVGLEKVYSAIDQIAQTTLRKVVGQHTLDQTLSETDKINLDIRKILDVTTVEWGVEVTLAELRDIQLPDSMKRAMARQAGAEREKRAKSSTPGESLAAAALGDASNIMMAHPLALQLRNLQSLVEIGVDKNTTVVFPARLMATIAELGSFLAPGKASPTQPLLPAIGGKPIRVAAANYRSRPSRNGRARLSTRRPASRGGRFVLGAPPGCRPVPGSHADRGRRAAHCRSEEAGGYEPCPVILIFWLYLAGSAVLLGAEAARRGSAP
jgi:hypothetical protein